MYVQCRQCIGDIVLALDVRSVWNIMAAFLIEGPI
jgi:hypothetical protein